MTAMTGRVNDFLFFGDIVQSLHVIEFDAVVYLVPQAAQHHIDHANRRVGDVRTDLHRVGVRFFARSLLPTRIITGFGENRLAH